MTRDYSYKCKTVGNINFEKSNRASFLGNPVATKYADNVGALCTYIHVQFFNSQSKNIQCLKYVYVEETLHKKYFMKI